MNAFLDQLRAIVGPANLLIDDLETWERDWRKRYRGKALAVARPGNTGEVAALVKACAAQGVSIVPQGGNTGLVEGGVPDQTGQQLVISLQRLNHIHHIDPGNMTITVGAGCVLQTLQTAAEAAGFLFPLSLGAEGSCVIGGNLATNAGGTQVLRYGNARELCLGLEVVTAQGEVWDGLSGLRKDNTGYDLRDLFIGSEGTLGIITAATLKLYPLPAAQLTAWAAVPSLAHAATLLTLARQMLGAGLTGFEVMEKVSLQLVNKHFPQLRVPFVDTSPWCVLLETSDHESLDHARTQFEALFERALADQCATDAIVAESLTQAKALWHIRESITLAQAQEGPNIRHDISIPVSSIPSFVTATDAQLHPTAPGVRIVNFGHLGDGNLHYNLHAPEGVDPMAFIADHEDTLSTVVYDSVRRFNGSISAEHGVGSLKRDKLPHYKSPVALGMMRAIKQALDPQNVMNPGRVITDNSRE